jgi:hypothetical protein
MRRRSSLGACGVLAAGLGLVIAVTGSAAGNDAGYEGFGTSTPGGAGGEVVRVTTLASSGPGSLREAVAAGNRTVVFDVAGEIVLDDYIYVKGAFVTIDGSSAPFPGITLVGRGLVIRGSRGAHDVIVRGIRIRNSPLDNLQVSAGAYNVVISHVSTVGAGDGNLDVTEGAHDVTVAWSLIGQPASNKSMLIKYGASRITLHHNLFVNSNNRNPQASVDDLGTPATDTTLDMRNNVVWAWGPGTGTFVHHGAWVNLVRNYYASPSSSAFDRAEALMICSGSPKCLFGDPRGHARGFVQGNVDGDGLTAHINGQGTEGTPFAAPALTTTDACTAAREVLAGAGVRPLDALDAGLVAAVTLPGCPPDRAASIATLVSDVNPSTDGDTATFAAAVSGADPADAMPTGTVEILDDGAVLASLPLVDGQAVFSTPALSTGQHTIVARYLGDAAFDVATSAPVVQTVRGSPSRPATNQSTLRLDAVLVPCCGSPVSAIEAAVSRQNRETNNVVRRDTLKMEVALPLPAAGIVDRRSARRARLRAVFSRGGVDYAECDLRFDVLETRKSDAGDTLWAAYRLVIDVKPRSDGTPKISRAVGTCNVSGSGAVFVLGLPDVAHGDVATVIMPQGDTYTVLSEGTFNRP